MWLRLSIGTDRIFFMDLYKYIYDGAVYLACTMNSIMLVSS
jgi:hypothetical protein